MAFALSESNAVDYLLGEGLVSHQQAGSASVRELGGGVSNIVVRVDFADRSDGVVIKQSLPRLRVEQEWLADQARIHREAAALRYLEDVLPPLTLPSVAHEDPGQLPVRDDRRPGKSPDVEGRSPLRTRGHPGGSASWTSVGGHAPTFRRARRCHTVQSAGIRRSKLLRPTAGRPLSPRHRAGAFRLVRRHRS